MMTIRVVPNQQFSWSTAEQEQYMFGHETIRTSIYAHGTGMLPGIYRVVDNQLFRVLPGSLPPSALSDSRRI